MHTRLKSFLTGSWQKHNSCIVCTPCSDVQRQIPLYQGQIPLYQGNILRYNPRQQWCGSGNSYLVISSRRFPTPRLATSMDNYPIQRYPNDIARNSDFCSACSLVIIVRPMKVVARGCWTDVYFVCILDPRAARSLLNGDVALIIGESCNYPFGIFLRGLR